MPTLLLTRPRAQAADWLARLQALGVVAQSLPLIEIAPPASSDEAEAARAALAAGVDLAVFVSPNAVEQFFAGAQAAWPAGTLAACVGPGSAVALQAAGVPAAQIVQPAPGASLDSEGLWDALQPATGWQGKRAIFLRGDGGREWLAEQLQAAGASTQAYGVYRRSAPSFEPAEQARLAEALADPAHVVWLFSSAEAVGNLIEQCASGQSWHAHRALATHPRIAQRCAEAGFGHVVLTRPDAGAVAQALSVL